MGYLYQRKRSTPGITGMVDGWNSRDASQINPNDFVVE